MTNSNSKTGASTKTNTNTYADTNSQVYKAKLKAFPNFDTLAVHAGEHPDPITGAIAPNIVRSKTFKQKKFREEAEYQYGRGKNPTRNALEEKLASLEIGTEVFAAVFSSGNAAVTNLFLTLNSGDHILLGKEVYGGTYRILDRVFKKFGILFDFVDFNNEIEVRAGIKPATKYFFVESISNPSLHVVDLRLVQKISAEVHIPIIIDGTFLPPNAIQYFDYGVETIIYSLSKYFAGHNDVIGGAIVTRNSLLHEQLKGFQRAVGAVLSPDETYRVLQGIKTLGLRWDRVSATAYEVARYLESNSKIKRVIYPLLESHPDFEISCRQLQNGAGGVVSIELATNDLVEIEKFVTKLTESGIIIYAESLASPQTILAYPAWMSHRAIPVDDRDKLGIADSFFRLSVGFENVEDIIAEFEKTLLEI